MLGQEILLVSPTIGADLANNSCRCGFLLDRRARGLESGFGAERQRSARRGHLRGWSSQEVNTVDP